MVEYLGLEISPGKHEFLGADVVETSLQYLYSDGETWNFMDSEYFEQHAAGADVVGD